MSVSEGLATDERPALDGTPVAGLPVSVFGFQDETGIDDEVKRGFILKADIYRMIFAGSEDLDKIHRFAFDFFKAVERAPTVTADCGLATLGFSKAE